MKTLAVHLHIHYKEQLDEILLKLANLQGVDYDLLVTVTDYDEKIATRLKAFNPEVKIIQVENRGYDIGPFVEFLHHINLDDYQYILKLHTKAKHSQNYTHLNNMRFDNALWGKILWDALLATPERVQEDIKRLQNRQAIFSKFHETRRNCRGIGAVLPRRSPQKHAPQKQRDIYHITLPFFPQLW